MANLKRVVSSRRSPASPSSDSAPGSPGASGSPQVAPRAPASTGAGDTARPRRAERRLLRVASGRPGSAPVESPVVAQGDGVVQADSERREIEGPSMDFPVPRLQIPTIINPLASSPIAHERLAQILAAAVKAQAAMRELRQCCSGTGIHRNDHDDLTESVRFEVDEEALIFESFDGDLFHRIRQHDGIAEEDFVRGISDLLPMPANSKSGQVFCQSSDRLLVVKTVREHEGDALRQVLPEYAREVTTRRSLMARYLGLYRIVSEGTTGAPYVVVMASVFGSNAAQVVFDLKGSTLGRDGEGGVRKDNDWVMANRRVLLGPEDHQQVVAAHRADSQWLSKWNFMDYSLLLGLRATAPEKQGSLGFGCWMPTTDGAAICFGMVDLLTEYDLVKQGEAAWRSLQGAVFGGEASCVNPETYARRQHKFLVDQVLGRQQQKRAEATPFPKPTEALRRE